MIRLPIALQVYSLRDLFTENPLKTMRAIREMGYTGVEFFGNYFKPEFYAALLKETGLVCAGWHTDIYDLEQNFDNVIERNLAVGNKFVCVPWFSAPSVDEWLNFAERLNVIAEKLAPYGLRTGFHCHAHEFQSIDGKLPWDIVAQNTIPQVILQVDTGNALCGNADVLSTLKKYAGRNQTIHFKPYSKATGYDSMAGEDDQDWEAIMSYCEQSGNTEWVIVEYECEQNPETAVKNIARFLLDLRPR